ncbi:MAG: PspC domain-containing protein [Pirellulales bacterium]|jgi:phage shock protein PspC (stress-responsive transcriptional regulator)
MRNATWMDESPRQRRPGLLFGVCRWTADRLGIAATWVRLAVIMVALWTSWWAMAAIYLAIAIALGRTVSRASDRSPFDARNRSSVRDWSTHASDGFWSRMAELERRLDSAEHRLRRSRT